MGPTVPVPTLPVGPAMGGIQVVGSIQLFADVAGNAVTVAAAAGNSSSAVVVSGPPATVEAALTGGAFSEGPVMEWEAAGGTSCGYSPGGRTWPAQLSGGR